MAQPPPYTRTANLFTQFSTNYPTTPHSGVNLDADFNNIATTIAAILVNLALIQRDDGQVANASIGLDQLKPEAALGLGTPTTWAATTAYLKLNSVIHNGAWYWCNTAHTSQSTFAADSAKWTLVFDFNPFIASVALGTSTPLAAGLAAAGVTTLGARQDHVHPSPYVFTDSSNTDPLVVGQSTRVTAAVTKALPAMSVGQTLVVARDTAAGSVTVGLGPHTSIAGDPTGFDIDADKKIILFTCVSAGVIRARYIGDLDQ